MIDAIIKWNFRDFCQNVGEIKMFMLKYNPLEICIQEPFVDQTKSLDFYKYSTYKQYSEAINGKPTGE